MKTEYGKGLPENQRNRSNVMFFGSIGIVGYHGKPYTKGTSLIIGRKGNIGRENTFSDGQLVCSAFSSHTSLHQLWKER